MNNSLALAKLFWTGRSQAVRLPKDFRFEGEAVQIRRQGRAVVLEPIAADQQPWAWLQAFRTEPVDDDFAQAVAEPLAPQYRPALDDLDV